MKLYLNDTSPFSRVVLATVALVQPDQFKLEWVDPWQSPEKLKKVNPFCTIPVLELEDGTALVESLCICQYLIETYQPKDVTLCNAKQQSDIYVMGLAKTLMELAFRTVALSRFTAKDNELIERGSEGVKRCLTRLERDLLPEYGRGIIASNITTLYLHVALDYVEFRHHSAFVSCAGQNIQAFLENSPFRNILQYMTPERLSSLPQFNDLSMNPELIE